MASRNFNTPLGLTWPPLLGMTTQTGYVAPYRYTEDGNLAVDDIDDYIDDTDDYNEDTEDYGNFDEYHGGIENYGHVGDYNGDSGNYDEYEYYDDDDDDDDDDEVHNSDDDDDGDVYKNPYDNSHDYNYNYIFNNYHRRVAEASYITRLNRREVPILPETQPPETLYRIHYSESVTKYSHHLGFRANDQSSSGPVTLKEFHNHLNWRSRTPSRFISTFSDKSHAFAWGKNWQQKHPWGWYFIMTIEPHWSDKIYHMETVIDQSGVGIPFDCPLQATQPDEYLYFRQIPEDRIVELFDPDMGNPMDSWRLVHELSIGVASSHRQEERPRAGQDLVSSTALLLAMGVSHYW